MGREGGEGGSGFASRFTTMAAALLLLRWHRLIDNNGVTKCAQRISGRRDNYRRSVSADLCVAATNLAKYIASFIYTSTWRRKEKKIL